MARRHWDWMAQAERDLEHAKKSLDIQDFEWVCFAAQQAAEKAIKAVIESKNGKSKTHSLLNMITTLGVNNEDIIHACMRLDRNYFLPRYPNGFSSGYPGQYYFRKDAEQAIADSESIIKLCKSKIVE